MQSDKQYVGEADCVNISYQIWHQAVLLESNAPEASVTYQMGEGHWPSLIEKAMCGQMLDTRIKLEFKAQQNVFGVADPERIMSLLRSDFDTAPAPGELISFTMPEGDQIEGQVIGILGDKIEVDFNHPYAGRDLRMDIQILAINKVVS